MRCMGLYSCFREVQLQDSFPVLRILKKKLLLHRESFIIFKKFSDSPCIKAVRIFLKIEIDRFSGGNHFFRIEIVSPVPQRIIPRKILVCIRIKFVQFLFVMRPLFAPHGKTIHDGVCRERASVILADDNLVTPGI